MISKDDDPKDNTKFISLSKKELLNIGIGFITVFKAAIGTGILFSPKGVVNTGYVASILIMLYYWLLNLISVLLLMKCADKVKGNYSSIATFAMGKYGRVILEVCLMSTAISFGSVYVTFITNNIQDIISGIHNCSYKYSNYGSAFITFIQLVVYLPLVSTNKIQTLAPFILISNISLISAIVLILIQSFSKIVKNHQKSIFNYIPPITSTEMIPGFVGTAAYLWVCAPVTLSYYVSLNEKKEKKMFTWIYILSILIVFIFASAFTFLCAFAYGKDTLPAITLNLPFTPIAICSKLLYSLSVLLSLPLIIYPMREIFSRYSKNDEKNGTRNRVNIKNSINNVGDNNDNNNNSELKIMSEKSSRLNSSKNISIPIEIEIGSICNDRKLKTHTMSNEKPISNIERDKLMFKKFKLSYLQVEDLFSLIFMFITCITITIIGYILHDFLGNLINLIGGLFCVPLNILLPAMFHLILFRKEINIKILVLDVFVILSSIFTSILVIWYSTQNWSTNAQSFCAVQQSKVYD
ncbi:amino acid transporter [Cryptosporidium ryanae]|uniref:amino acid transporter n=1 Tax=Cryptosporidium ryanae TaxID=515981 RepID=UPI00351A788F|nr:amino acid transporter [Cryptosporidium ryanae]